MRYGVARYNLDGSLDASFGSGGKVTTPVTGTGNFPPAEPHGVTVDSNGRVIISGWAQNPSSGQSSFTLMRYSSGGTLDPDLRDGRSPVHGLRARRQGQRRRPRCCRPDRRTRRHEAGGTGATKFAIARYGTAPVLRVDPNTELNPAGSAPVINGWGFPPSATLSLQQCNGGTCATIGSPSTDTTGHFTTSSATVSYALPGGSCPAASCKLVVSGTGFTPAEAPISFAASTSIVVSPSRGGILQGDSIKVGDVITARADLNGGAGGVPTGTVSFFSCGPVVSPATCAVGGTARGTPALSPAGGSAATATSSSVSFGSPGRYCFRAVYAGDGLHRAASDSSKAACVAVRSAPGTGPVVLEDFYQGAPGDSIADGSPGVMQNDIFGGRLRPDGATRHGPRAGDALGGLNSDGSFTYIPNNASVTSDSFTYQVQDTHRHFGAGEGLDRPDRHDLDRGHPLPRHALPGHPLPGHPLPGNPLPGHALPVALRRDPHDLRGVRLALGVGEPRRSRVFDQTYLEVSAALYDAAGHRIASIERLHRPGRLLRRPRRAARDRLARLERAGAGRRRLRPGVRARDTGRSRASPRTTIDSNIVGCQT